jgi:hypothetical protein
VAHDEHADWQNFHKITFIGFTMFFAWLTFYAIFCHSDWYVDFITKWLVYLLTIFRPSAKEWALREAHFELERRQKAGLPLISKNFIDPERVAKTLPSGELFCQMFITVFLIKFVLEEELRDFDILI